jgi:hypothetical protein
MSRRARYASFACCIVSRLLLFASLSLAASACQVDASSDFMKKRPIATTSSTIIAMNGMLPMPRSRMRMKSSLGPWTGGRVVPPGPLGPDGKPYPSRRSRVNGAVHGAEGPGPGQPPERPRGRTP